MGKSNNLIVSLVVAGAVVAAFAYWMRQKDDSMYKVHRKVVMHPSMHHDPKHVVFVDSVPHKHEHALHHLEEFAFSDIKNTYVSGGHSDVSLAADATSQNIGGILTNTKDDKGQVINVGMNLMNEYAMGQRDDRVVENYYMNEHQYGAGTPNYRKLRGWY
jgi:hypothetical protein